MKSLPERFRRAVARSNCLSCGKPIFRVEGAGPRPKFCSAACRQAAYRGRYAHPQADLPRVTNCGCNSLKSLAEKSRKSGVEHPD